MDFEAFSQFAREHVNNHYMATLVLWGEVEQLRGDTRSRNVAIFVGTRAVEGEAAPHRHLVVYIDHDQPRASQSDVGPDIEIQAPLLSEAYQRSSGAVDLRTSRQGWLSILTRDARLDGRLIRNSSSQLALFRADHPFLLPDIRQPSPVGRAVPAATFGRNIVDLDILGMIIDKGLHLQQT